MKNAKMFYLYILVSFSS